MLFKEVADFFSKIESVSSRLEMTDFVAKMLSKASPEEIKKIVYLSQGQLGPQFEEIDVGMGEKLVIDAIAKISGFSEKDIEKKFKEIGDLGLVAEQSISKKKQSSLFSEKLSLEKVFENFLKMSKSEGSGSQELKIKLLAELLNSASGVESRYLTRIPLQNLRLGIGDPTIMDALALEYLVEFRKSNPQLEKDFFEKFKTIKDETERKENIERQLKFKLREKIEEKYNVYADLGEIAKALKQKGLKALEEIHIQAGIPIRPTLAERLPSAEEIIKKLGKCAVEAKYDGFRIAIHKNSNDVKIFSRRMENMTKMFPEIVEAVKEQIGEKTAIFEGEALAFNELTGEYLPFQVTIQRKRKYDVGKMAEEFPLKLFAFDVLMIDGKSTMDLPFIERRKKLKELIKKGNVIELTKSIETSSPKEIDRFFNECVEKGLEGIIAKDLNAKYIAGARKFAWIKLKRSYKGELSDSIDAVIIGYFKGKGHRTQFGLGTLLVGVYNDENDSFESIAKIGTGMSEAQLENLEKILSKIKKSAKPARVVSEMEPDVWVEPQYVIEVRADEITKSPTHSCAKEKTGEGLALRFPRMISIREDKKPEEATTTREIIEMFKMQKRTQLENPEFE